MMDFKDGHAAQRALLKYDWANIGVRLHMGTLDRDGRRLTLESSTAMHDLSWAFNDLFKEFGRGHLTFSVDTALEAVEHGFPDWGYELSRKNGGWFFRLGNYEGANFSHRSLAIYEGICLVIARWKREVEAGAEKV